MTAIEISHVSKSYREVIRRTVQLYLSEGLGLKVGRTGPVTQEVISLFRNNIGKRAGVIRDASYKRLHGLMDHCTGTGKGKLLGVRSPKGKLLWGIFMIDTGDRITLLFTAGSRKSRELRTSYHVIDHIIKANAGTGKTIDFAGSSVPSIAIFMKSFGGTDNTYYRLYSNMLPWPARLFR